MLIIGMLRSPGWSPSSISNQRQLELALLARILKAGVVIFNGGSSGILRLAILGNGFYLCWFEILCPVPTVP